MRIPCLLLCIALCLLSRLLITDDAVRFFHAEDERVPMNTLDLIRRTNLGPRGNVTVTLWAVLTREK
jgi:hypothetical protein